MDIPEKLGVVIRTAFTFAFMEYVMLNIANNTNLAFSPYSLLAVLSVIAPGCSESPVLENMLSFMDTESAQEQIEFIYRFVQLLFFEWTDVGDLMKVKVKFGTSVWIDQSLSVDPSFKSAVETVYKSALNQVDFRNKANEVAAEVNLWAETRTGGQINDVVPSGSVDGSTKLVFVNANYFKGVWMRKFNPAETIEDVFYLLDGTSVVLAPFITSKKKQYIRVCDGFKVLGLQYDCGSDQRQFSMFIFLPDARDGLQALIEKYCEDPEFLELHLPRDPVEVSDFKIPKFKISFGFDASDVLKDIGLCSPSPSKEELDVMTDTVGCVDLFVSSIFHKTFIEINEDGTHESGKSMKLPKRVPPPNAPRKVDFVADHPFMFVIRDNVLAVALIVGHVLNPLLEG